MNMGARFVCMQVENHHQIGKTPAQQHGHAHCPYAPYEEPPQANRPTCVVIRSKARDFPHMSQGQFIVVRPDRFILGVFKETNADKFISAFQSLLQCTA